jgi:stearoyl-CoA desaturase (Delta-9 desaturase)
MTRVLPAFEVPQTPQPGRTERPWERPLPMSAVQSAQYLFVALATAVVPLVGTIYAACLFWQQGIGGLDVALTVGMYVFTILGIELGYHRFLTHHALKTPTALKALMVVVGAMAAHGPPIWWVAIHRRHHGYSDQEGDPHSPNLHGGGLLSQLAGLWHAHIGWMFRPQSSAAYASVFAKDLLRDPLVQAIDRWYVLWVLLGLAIPAGLGGLIGGSWQAAWTGLVWGGLVRMFLGHHALWWGIVTVCHFIGTRPFESHDDSRNNLLVAVIFLGDGWHNNHHAFPASAKVGLRWWQIDPTWWAIRALQRAGLAWDVHVPTPDAIAARLRRGGEGP